MEEARLAEQSARAAAEEAELLRRVISQLPRPIMATRTETSITLSLARLIKSSGGDKVLTRFFPLHDIECPESMESRIDENIMAFCH